MSTKQLFAVFYKNSKTFFKLNALINYVYFPSKLFQKMLEKGARFQHQCLHPDDQGYQQRLRRLLHWQELYQ